MQNAEVAREALALPSGKGKGTKKKGVIRPFYFCVLRSDFCVPLPGFDEVAGLLIGLEPQGG